MQHSNIISINNDVIRDTESKILEMKDIDHQMKVLDARREKLKSHVIANYFHDHLEFTGSEGLVLATYKPQIQVRFKSKDFEKEHPALYDQYSYLIEFKTFLVKK